MGLFNPDRKLFIHETTVFDRGGIDDFNRGFSELYQPAMEQCGARLFGHWQAVPFNSHWPEISTLWEIDSLAHFGELTEARLGRGEVGERFQAWQRTMDEMGGKGEGRFCYGNEGIRSVAELKTENFNASAIVQEFMTTRPGMQNEYLEQLERLFVPFHAKVGMKWLGSFVSMTRNEEVIHYWAYEGGWSAYGKGGLDPSTDMQELKAAFNTWMKTAPALRDSWDDSFLAALPQNPLMG